jgi:hypothetical protein
MTDDDRIDALVRDLPEAEVPAGFADTIVALHQRNVTASTSRRRTMIASVAAAAVGVCAALVVVDRETRDLSAEIVADARQSVALGADAAAVFEPGARATYAVDGRIGADRIEVTQPQGRAFYRVAPGTEMTVKTPGGDVSVHGTCFTVDVISQENDPMSRTPSLKPLASHAATAVLGATLAVVVVEGTVTVANAQGSVSAHPGETVVAHANGAPALAPTRVVERVVPPGSVVMSREELAALRAAASSTPDITALVKRNSELEDKLRKADEELALTDEVRKAEEGQPMKFPDDMAPRFQGDALQRAFEQGMNEVGIQGGVISVDCSEYPCIVYGQLTGREDMEKLRETDALKPYRGDSNSTSVWSVKKDGTPTAYFGVQLTPDGEEMDELANKRQEKRMRDGWEKIKPEKR